MDMKTNSRSAAAFCALSLLSASLLAGGLTLQIGNPAANAEAEAKKAVLVARVTACQSPEKTKITATAEGVLNGARKSIPLSVIPLSAEGTFAITRQWPEQGTWALKLVARNPDYKNYATGVVVPFQAGSAQWASIQHYFHEPTDTEVAKLIGVQPVNGGKSLD
jgi:hypothetical protein